MFLFKKLILFVKYQCLSKITFQLLILYKVSEKISFLALKSLFAEFL